MTTLMSLTHNVLAKHREGYLCLWLNIVYYCISKNPHIKVFLHNHSWVHIHAVACLYHIHI